MDVFRRKAVPAIEKFFKIYILHKSKIFAFHRLYCFRLINGKSFHQPAEFLAGQRSDFRSVAGPLELPVIQTLLQEHESITVEVESFHRIFLRPQNRKTALEKGSIWKLSRMIAMSPQEIFSYPFAHRPNRFSVLWTDRRSKFPQSGYGMIDHFSAGIIIDCNFTAVNHDR